MAKRKIEILAGKIYITEVGNNEVLQALQNKEVNDFEDGLEYYSALAGKCDAIITEDISDFYLSSTPVFNSRAFAERHQR